MHFSRQHDKWLSVHGEHLFVSDGFYVSMRGMVILLPQLQALYDIRRGKAFPFSLLAG